MDTTLRTSRPPPPIQRQQQHRVHGVGSRGLVCGDTRDSHSAFVTPRPSSAGVTCTAVTSTVIWDAIALTLTVSMICNQSSGQASPAAEAILFLTLIWISTQPVRRRFLAPPCFRRVELRSQAYAAAAAAPSPFHDALRQQPRRYRYRRGRTGSTSGRGRALRHFLLCDLHRHGSRQEHHTTAAAIPSISNGGSGRGRGARQRGSDTDHWSR